MLLTLLLCLAPEVKIISAEGWSQPVYQAIGAYLSDQKLFLFDANDGLIKAYDGSKGWQDPVHLWSKGGFGAGPGEFAKPIRINNITLSWDKALLFVSYNHGINVYAARTGRFQYRIKAPAFHAWIYNSSEHTLLTSHEPVFDRTLLRTWSNANFSHLRNYSEESDGKIPHPTRVPVNKDGVALQECPELLEVQSKLLIYDFCAGTLTRISEEHTILDYSEITPWRWSETFFVDDHLDPHHFKKRLEMRRLSAPFSGAAVDQEHIWLMSFGPKPYKTVTLNNGREANLTERVLIQLDHNGASPKYLRHPLLNHNHSWNILLGTEKEHLLLFTLRGGSELLMIPKAKLVPFK